MIHDFAPFLASWPHDYSPMEELLSAAKEAQATAHVPYSKFPVGAALLLKGTTKLIKGCNVENASYGLSLCAERNALTAMVAAGAGRYPLAIAVVGASGKPCLPCGACRQFLAEFNPAMLVVLEDGSTGIVLSLAALFPVPFLLEKEKKDE